MQTHDEETRKFFKHSSVMCVLAPRYASRKSSYVKQQASNSSCFSINVDWFFELQLKTLISSLANYDIVMYFTF